MRFPSLALLADRAREVMGRFPWTLTAGAAAAGAAIEASTATGDAAERWLRIAFVLALGIPLTFALSLLAETRRWRPALLWGAMAASALALFGFFTM